MATLLEQFQQYHQALQDQAQALYAELVQRADAPKPADAKRLTGALATLGRTIDDFTRDVAAHHLAQQVETDDIDALSRELHRASTRTGQIAVGLEAEKAEREKRLAEAKRAWDVAGITRTAPRVAKQRAEAYQRLEAETEQVLADLQASLDAARETQKQARVAHDAAVKRRDRLTALTPAGA